MKAVVIPLLLSLIQQSGSADEPAYRFTDLGVFPLVPGVHSGDPPIQPRDISNAGAIVSTVRTAPYPDIDRSAILQYRGENRVLGVMGGWYRSQGERVNDYGQVSGEAGASGLTHAFRWQDGAFVELDLGALHTYDADLNNVGQIVGWNFDADLEIRAFLWTEGQVIDLGTSCDGCFSTQARGLNDHGTVVGRVLLTSGWRSFLWDATTDLVVLDTVDPEDTYSSAHDINNRGTVIGVSGVSGYVAYAGGPMIALGALPFFCCSRPLDINESDQVVGVVDDSNGHERAFLYHDGVMIDLNDAVATPPGVVLERATAINDLGQIVGSTNKGRGFLLTPKGLFINTPFPGTVDRQNTVHLSGSTAGAEIRLFASPTPGSTSIPGCAEDLELGEAELVGRASRTTQAKRCSPSTCPPASWGRPSTSRRSTCRTVGGAEWCRTPSVDGAAADRLGSFFPMRTTGVRAPPDGFSSILFFRLAAAVASCGHATDPRRGTRVAAPRRTRPRCAIGRTSSPDDRLGRLVPLRTTGGRAPADDGSPSCPLLPPSSCGGLRTRDGTLVRYPGRYGPEDASSIRDRKRRLTGS